MPPTVSPGEPGGAAVRAGGSRIGRGRYHGAMARQLPNLAGTINRRRRLLAAGLDAAGVFAATAVALVIATIWLLSRSGLGRDDAGDGDAVLALSLVAAVVPAWTVYLGAGLWLDGRTPGQRRLGVTVGPREAAQWRRALRLALHPLSLPAWGWLALTAALSGLPWLWLPVAAAAAAIALAGAVSFVLLAVRPSLPSVHDRLTRTMLLRSEPAAPADGP